MSLLRLNLPRMSNSWWTATSTCVAGSRSLDRVNETGAGILHSAWRMDNVLLAVAEGTVETHLLPILKKQLGTTHVRLSGHGYSLANFLQFLRLKLMRFNPNSHVLVYIDGNFSTKVGSFHQKTTCFLAPSGVSVLLGSLDLTKRRRDSNLHTRKSSAARRPSHDVGLMVTGGAAHGNCFE